MNEQTISGFQMTEEAERPAESQSREVVAQRNLTPMSVLNQAVTSGASVDVLAQLLALQRDYERDEARKAFSRAMAEAKAEIPVIIKNKTVDFQSAKGRTFYQYEDMAGIAEIVTPILAQHGLSFRHRTKNEGKLVTVTCVIEHELGHSEENTLNAEIDLSGNKNAIQAIGSVVTYLQRYTLKAALGLAAATDDDARGATKPQRRPPSERRDERVEDADTGESDAPYQPHVVQGEPRAIAHKGRRPEEWAADYKATLGACENPQEMLRWQQANANALSQLGEAFPDIRRDVDDEFARLLRETQVTSGKRKPPSAAVEQFDSDQWRKDMEGGLSGCEDNGSLEKYRQEIDSAPDGVLKQDLEAVRVALNQAFDRINVGK